MESSCVWSVLATIFMCVGLSSALSDAELLYFKTGVSTEAFPSTTVTLYPKFQISSCTRSANPRTGAATSSYHLFDLNNVPWYDYSAMTYKSWRTNRRGVDTLGYEIAEKVTSTCIPTKGTYQGGSYQSETEITKGLLGFAISGSPLWYYETDTVGNAVDLEAFDTCGGHASPGNVYHVHGWDDWAQIGNGCFTGFNINACPATIIGVALDGFPVYSAQICECVTTASDGSCSEWPTTPSGYFEHSPENQADIRLDDCNGRKVDSAKPIQSSDVNAEHIYEYRLTLDLPYHIGCLKGETAAKNTCTARVTTCDVMPSNAKRSGEVLEKIAMKALEEGAGKHLRELDDILVEAAREVEEEDEKMKEREEKKMKQEERKVEEEGRRANKQRALLEGLMDGY